MKKCRQSAEYFIANYCFILNANESGWIRFDLWDAQRGVLEELQEHRYIVLLKARQLGLTWLYLCYLLWLMLFRPVSVIGIFSRIETDAKELLDTRLKGIYERLPSWMQASYIKVDNTTRWELGNGSTAMAFATTGGRQYTFSYILVDEADYQPDLKALLQATKPAVDAGGSLALISTADKGKPESLFKSIYRQGKQNLNEYHAIFLPWSARPERTQAWYEAQKRDCLANTTVLDDVHQEYPATDTEALAPRSLDKRIPHEWLEAIYSERDGNNPLGIPGCTVYVEPEEGRQYVIGADPAEGNPNSDDSAATVLDKETGEEVAVIAGKYQPSTFAGYIDQLGIYYNRAAAMVERNNHGHAVLLALGNSGEITRLKGQDGKEGWLSSHKGKTVMYDAVTDAIRDGEIQLHSFETVVQLGSIEGSTLLAPDGQHDDRADSVALAWQGVLTRTWWMT